MAGGGQGHGGGGSMRWLLTYADMITLLMVFFIVLFAMANVDKERYARLARSLQVALGGGSGLFPGADGTAGQGAADTPVPRDLPLPPAQDTSGTAGPAAAAAEDALARLGRDLAVDLEQDGRFAVYSSERGLVISLVGSALFDPGKAAIRPEARPLLQAIAGRIRQLENDISVEGSADDRPINTPIFPSNWELSVRRATEVVRYFTEVEGLDPHRFIAVGYAEYRPVFDNATAEGRARNRRVDIVILRQRYRVELGQRVSGSPSDGRGGGAATSPPAAGARE